MKHNELTDHYLKFTEAFYVTKKTDFDLETNEISESIFKHIFKIKLAQWKFREHFKRKKKTINSDLFQDIIAYYLKIYLSDEYEIILEEKKGKLQPDILIKYNQKEIFIIEIKTTLGWARKSIKNEIPKRIENLSSEFNIPKSNIVYILQSPWNVNKKFRERYWNAKEKIAQDLPVEFPYNKIRPLLANDDPYYNKSSKQEYSVNELDELAKKSVVIPFEQTIKEIITAANNGNRCTTADSEQRDDFQKNSVENQAIEFGK